MGQSLVPSTLGCVMCMKLGSGWLFMTMYPNEALRIGGMATTLDFSIISSQFGLKCGFDCGLLGLAHI